MRNVIIQELTTYGLLISNTNLNTTTIPTIVDLWLADLKEEVYTLELLPEAFRQARLQSEYLPRPRDVIRCYHELVGRKQVETKQIEHYIDRYEPTKEEWDALRQKCKNGFK